MPGLRVYQNLAVLDGTLKQSCLRTPRGQAWSMAYPRDLGIGRFRVRNIPCQLADDKFLKDIDGGRFANPDECVFEG